MRTTRTATGGTALGAALLALALPLATACDAPARTADCATVAGSIGGDVTSLRKAASKPADDPTDAATAIRKIQSDIDEIAGKTNNAATAKSINALSTGLDNAKNDLDNGIKPNVQPIVDAAAAFAKSCVTGSTRSTGQSG